MTSRIERHACGVERTSSVLVSSTADTPTESPWISRLKLALPGWRCGRLMVPSPMPPVRVVPLLPVLLRLLPLVPSRLPSSWVIAPGASEPPLPRPLRLLSLAKASARRSARSLALT
ncbi:hypothetical protein D9M72_633490 [compost metagenome]